MSEENKSTPVTLFFRALILCLCFVLFGVSDFAQGQVTPEKTGEKSKRIKEIIADRKFETRIIGNYPSKQFCITFLQDFRNQNGIEYIEPILSSESIDDPIWAPYKKQCPNLEMFEHYACLARDVEYFSTLPEAEKQDYRKAVCEHFRGTKSFKMFSVDINNNPRDGKETIFYYERAQGPLNQPSRKLIYGDGGYQVVNLGRCEIVASVGTKDPYSYSYERHLSNINSVVRYRGKYYIVDLFGLEGKGDTKSDYKIHLDGYASNPQGGDRRLMPLCSFSTIFLSNKK